MNSNSVWFPLVLVLVMCSVALALPAPNDTPEEHAAESEALQKYRALTFLGTFNSKSYYYDSEKKSQMAARASCESMGLKLIEFDSQNELDFVNDNAFESHCWTAAAVKLVGPSFVWLHSGTPLSASFSSVFSGGTHIGLTVSVGSYGRLYSYDINTERCYYCYS